MADKYAEMDHKEYAKLVMAPGEQTWSQKILNFAKGTTFSAVLVLTGISGYVVFFFPVYFPHYFLFYQLLLLLIMWTVGYT